MSEAALIEPTRWASSAIDDIALAEREWQRANRRPRALSAREALAAVQFECLLVCIAAGNLANGVELTEEDFDRIKLAHARIQRIAEEVNR